MPNREKSYLLAQNIFHIEYENDNCLLPKVHMDEHVNVDLTGDRKKIITSGPYMIFLSLFNCHIDLSRSITTQYEWSKGVLLKFVWNKPYLAC
ncbi:hypothetical protein CR513_29277, partial [Mucuna pruriens]